MKEVIILLKTLQEEISFEATITMSLAQEDLIVQALFRKDDVPYFFMFPFSPTHIKIHSSTKLVSIFTEGLIDFYTKAKPNDCNSHELLSQKVLLNSYTEQE